MNRPHTHCPHCGHRFDPEAAWPRQCANCGAHSFLNPAPVAVLIQPVEGGGIVCVRRDIEPKRGQLSMPGGFVDLGERWQQAAAREFLEEVGVRIDPESIEVFDAISALDGALLIFGIAPPLAPEALGAFEPNPEVSEVLVIEQAQPLAWPIHTEVFARALKALGS